MRIACWIPKATDTHSAYVILIAFARQQWFIERASMLRLYVLFNIVIRRIGSGSDIAHYNLN